MNECLSPTDGYDSPLLKSLAFSYTVLSQFWSSFNITVLVYFISVGVCVCLVAGCLNWPPLVQLESGGWGCQPVVRCLICAPQVKSATSKYTQGAQAYVPSALFISFNQSWNKETLQPVVLEGPRTQPHDVAL